MSKGLLPRGFAPMLGNSFRFVMCGDKVVNLGKRNGGSELISNLAVTLCISDRT